VLNQSTTGFDPKQTKSWEASPKIPARGYLQGKLSTRHFTWAFTRFARMALSVLELKLSDGVTLPVPESLQSFTTYVLLEQERWFEKEMDFLRCWLRPGMTVIDIGANLGVYSVPMARLVGQTGHVFAYEPGSETRALLERSRGLNAA
jgi:hypothetical protein